MKSLSHLNEKGQAHMVEVGHKNHSQRSAVAESFVVMPPEIFQQIAAGHTPKGDIQAVCRVAAIMAAKKTPDLIPLCHPLPLSHISVDYQTQAPDRVRFECTVRCTGPTGVEMEALTAASIASLTFYDMVKALGHHMSIGPTRLLEKRGGKSDFQAGQTPA